MNARDLMNDVMATLPMTMGLELAAAALRRHNLTAAPVVDDNGRLVGLVDRIDLALPLHEADFGNRPRRRRGPTVVGDVMRTPVVSLTPGATADQVSRALAESSAPLIPITDGRSILGVIRRPESIRTQPRARRVGTASGAAG